MSKAPVHDTAFSMSRGPKKRPAEKDAAHLRFIHGLPCLICGQPGEAAHIRMGVTTHGKPGTGAGEKPSDKYAVPLCPEHHRTGKGAQHTMSEQKFWQSAGLDAVVISALLWQVTGDLVAAMNICANARTLVMWGGNVR